MVVRSAVWSLWRFLVVLGLLLGVNLGLYATDIQVKAPRDVDVNRPFNIKYILADVKGEVTKVEEPTTKGLVEVYDSRISQSYQMTIINGQTSQSSNVEVTYTYLAEQEGTYEVRGLKLKVNGKVVSAPSVRIRAVKEATHRSSNFRYFFRTNVSRRTPYEQEPIFVQYHFLSNRSYTILDLAPAKYDNFLVHELPQSGTRQPRRERVSGEDFIGITLEGKVLIPQTSGSIRVPGIGLSIQYRDDDSGDAFIPKMLERKMTAESSEIQVKPLPTEGRPDDFSGAVGRFTIEYQYERDRWATGEAFPLTIVIRGAGNIKLAKSPQLSLPDHVEIYDPIEHTDETWSGTALEVNRRIEYSLIARQTGVVELPALRFSYFDPSTEQYRTAQTTPKRIQIVKGRETSEASLVIEHSRGEGRGAYGLISAQGTKLYHSPGIGWWLLHILLAVAGWIGYRVLVLRRRERADVLGYSAARAARVATSRLKKARQHVQSGDTSALHEELLRSLWGYIGDKLRMPMADLSRQSIVDTLSAREIPTELIDELTATIDTIEYARYAPSSEQTCPETLYQRTASLIEQIERSASL